MTDGSRQERPVELFTTQGLVRGLLPTTPNRRTLDELNLTSRTFLRICRPESSGVVWLTPGVDLLVHKDSVLLLRELGSPPLQPPGQFARFTRAAIVLQLETLVIHGFMHVPPGGHPMKRLDQDPHGFVAVTSAVIATADGELTAPFVAVNRCHVGCAQDVGHAEPIVDLQPSSALEREA
jgi:hypothetical protein